LAKTLQLTPTRGVMSSMSMSMSMSLRSIDRCCGGALGITDVAIENVWAVDHQRFNGDETGGSDDHMADSTEVFSADFVDDSSRR
jgi:hypothetical protein